MFHHERIKNWLNRCGWRIITVSLVLAAVAAIWWSGPFQEEQPIYNGKPILRYFPQWLSPKEVQAGRGIRLGVQPRISGGGLGKPLPTLRNAFTFPGIGPEALPWLLRVVRREDFLLQRTYLRLQNRLPVTIQKALPVPVPAAQNRMYAVQLLYELVRLRPDESVPPLITALEKGTSQERIAAALALSTLGSQSMPRPADYREPLERRNPNTGSTLDALTAAARRALVNTLADSDSNVRQTAFSAVLRLRDIDEDSFVAICRFWTRQQPATQAYPSFLIPFSQLIAQQPASARSILPALAILQKDANTLVRVEAIYANWRIDPANARCGPDLLREFVKGTIETRIRAGEYLARSAVAMRLQASETVPAMMVGLDDVDPSLRAQAAKTLIQFKIEALPALPKLTVALRDPDRGLRAAAVSAIEAIGPAAPKTIPNLVEALRDPAAQAAAARALGAFGPAATAAVPALIELLSDPSRFSGSAELRSNAARALGLIGVAEASVQSALRQAADDPDPAIRDAAKEALTRLDSIGAKQ